MKNVRKSFIGLSGLLALGLLYSYTSPLPEREIKSAVASEGEISLKAPEKLQIGQKAQLSVSFSGINDASFTFTSDNSDVLSVDENGAVTANKEGTAKVQVVSVSDASIKDEKEITVVNDLDGKYEVQFVNYDGTLLYEEEINAGDQATYIGEEPTRPNGNTIFYTFDGWDKDLSTITGDTVVTAKYKETDGSSYFFEGENNFYTFIGYTGTDAEITIPTTFNGGYVTAIGSNVIEGNNSVKKINVPEGITSLADNAFSGSNSLEEITLPGSAYSVGKEIFKNDVNLKKVTFGEGYSSFGDYMFQGCKALTSLALPSTLASIGSMAFYEAGITSLEVPSSVISLGMLAFSGMSALTNITINASVAVYPTGLLANDIALTSLTLGGTVTDTGMNFLMKASSLKELVLPDTIEAIGESAFSEASSLSSLTLSKNLKSIGSDAFEKTALFADGSKGILLKEGDTNHKIGDGILYSDQGKSILTILDATKVPENLDFNKLGVTSVGDYVFKNNSTIKTLNLEGVTSIGKGAFDSLKNSTGALVLPSSITSAGEEAFEFNTFTSITIQGGFNGGVIPGSILRNSTKATLVVIESGITEIGEKAFGWSWQSWGNTTADVYIPKTVKKMGNFAFQNDVKATLHFEGSEDEWKAIEGINDIASSPSDLKVVFNSAYSGK